MVDVDDVVGVILGVVLVCAIVAAVYALDQTSIGKTEELPRAWQLDATRYEVPEWADGMRRLWKVQDREAHEDYWLADMGGDWVVLGPSEIGEPE